MIKVGGFVKDDSLRFGIFVVDSIVRFGKLLEYWRNIVLWEFFEILIKEL